MSGRTAALFEYQAHPEVRWGWGRPANGRLSSILGEGNERYRETLLGMNRYLANLSEIPRKPTNRRPCWENGYWTSLDPVMQYASLVDRRPQTYMEIGSGFSTLFARQAVIDHQLPTKIVSIDPFPRNDIDDICDEMHRCPLDQVDVSLFHRLEAGDILVVDGSHTVYMNSDTSVAFIDILPELREGVMVAIHDVFLPWDYPPDWVGRWYGEQYLVAALLLGNQSDWSVELPLWYVCHETELADDLNELWDVIGDPPGRTGSSIWLERR